MGSILAPFFLELRITLEKNSLLPVFTGCGQCVSSATDLMLLSSAGIFLCFRWINHALAIQSVFTLMWTHRLCFFALTCSHLLPQYQCGTNCFLHNSIHPCLWSLKLNYSEIMWPWLMDATDCPLFNMLSLCFNHLLNMCHKEQTPAAGCAKLFFFFKSFFKPTPGNGICVKPQGLPKPHCYGSHRLMCCL